ncbi:MAG: histidine kinase, partial [Treponema sp.]|nr:histidine kinase [Treponema sp.]
MPVAIMMALKTYEKQQLSMMENSNVQQGRLVSSAISAKDKTYVDEEFAKTLLQNMNNRFDSRIRILGKDGTLLLDSAKLVDDEKLDADSE